MSERTEFVPNDRAIWQASDEAGIYQCPYCLSPIFSQYTGTEKPTAVCHGPLKGHTLTWAQSGDVEGAKAVES